MFLVFRFAKAAASDLKGTPNGHAESIPSSLVLMPTAAQLSAKLSKKRLAELLAEACLENETLAHRLEIELLGDQAQAIADQLERRIDALTSDLDFIGYREAFGFGSELDAVVADIERTLLPLDPDLTVAICYHFLNTDSEVLNSVDDSSGSVGDSYRDDAALFARGAKKAQDRESVCDLTLDCIRNNDYGVRDPIMGSAGDFLKKREFDALLDALRQDFLDAPKTQFASSAQFRYEFVAKTKGDPELLRRVLNETKQGELGGYDRIQIAQTLCEKRRWQDALDLVADVDAKGSWVDMIEAIQLEAYQGLGQTEKVASIRRTEFLRYPSAERLQDWLDALAPEQRETARSEAIAYAESDDCYPYAALSFLVAIDETDSAAAMVQRRIDRFSGRQWETLPQYAHHFETDHPLVATLLYRKLLEDVLDNARSKAYAHAARYWRALAELATRIQFLNTQENEAAYKARLSERHKRKTSFWRAMDQ